MSPDADIVMSDGSSSTEIRSTPRFQLAVGSTVVLLFGVLGPWQRTLFGISANGLEVAPVLLVPALLLAGYAVYDYSQGQQRRKRIGWLLVSAAVLVGLAEIGNSARTSGLVVSGWGAVVAGIGGIGVFVSAVAVLRSTTLTR